MYRLLDPRQGRHRSYRGLWEKKGIRTVYDGYVCCFNIRIILKLNNIKAATITSSLRWPLTAWQKRKTILWRKRRRALMASRGFCKRCYSLQQNSTGRNTDLCIRCTQARNTGDTAGNFSRVWMPGTVNIPGCSLVIWGCRQSLFRVWPASLFEPAATMRCLRTKSIWDYRWMQYVHNWRYL